MFNHYNYFDNNNVRDTRFYVAMQGLSKGNMSQDLYDNFGKYVPRELPYTEENALRALELVKKDSRLGWEPSMDYIGGEKAIDWKLRHLEYVLEFEVGCFVNGSHDKWYEHTGVGPRMV